MWQNRRQHKYVCLFVPLPMRMGDKINCVAVLSFCIWKLGQIYNIYFAIQTNWFRHSDKYISTFHKYTNNFVSSCFIFYLCRPNILFGGGTKFSWYEYGMGIFLHKLPYKKNKHFLTVAISPNDNFPIHPWFMHCIAAKITLLTGKGNKWEAFTFYKALAVTIWLVKLCRKRFFLSKSLLEILFLFSYLENLLSRFSFSSRSLRIEYTFPILFSKVENHFPFSKFLFLFSKLEIF